MGRGVVRKPEHYPNHLWKLAALTFMAFVTVALAATAVANTSKGNRRGKSHNGGVVGAFYTQTNTPTGNGVVWFARSANGQLTEKAIIATDGKGASGTPPFDFPIVDGSGSVNLGSNGHLLFVVNAGDNTVSSFRVANSGRPTLVDHVSSGGTLPVSLTSNGHLLYVVNEGTSSSSGNIYGYRISNSGHLTPLGSSQTLNTLGPIGTAADPAEIDFSPNGHALVVTIRDTAQRSTGAIDTFSVGQNGKAGPATVISASAPNPFGFSFAGQAHVEVSHAGTVSAIPPNVADPTQFVGSASTYDLSGSTKLKAAGAPVASGARAACWLVVTSNNKYAFVTNTLSDTVADAGTGKGAVSRYKVAPGGTLTLLGQVSTGPPVGGPTFPSDMALSDGSRYLYVIEPTVMAGNTSHVDVYKVGSGGSLTLIQSSPGDLARGISGAAAR